MVFVTLLMYALVVSISFLTCDFSILQKQTLEIQFPKIPREALSETVRTRIVYYISHNKTLSFVVRDATSMRMHLRVYKGGAFPVLACLEVDTRFSFHTLGNAGCPFASGAVYPYDKADIGSVGLQYDLKAKVARLMLLFHQRGGNIRFLNIRKLSSVMNVSVPFINTDVFFQSLAQKRFSMYSIKTRKFFDVPVPTQAQEWVHSWISVTSTRFLVTKTSIKLPMGIWMFIKPHGDEYALISVNSNGTAMFSLH